MNKMKMIQRFVTIFFMVYGTIYADCPALISAPGSPFASEGLPSSLAYSPNSAYLAIGGGSDIEVFAVNNSSGALTVSSAATTLAFPSSIAWSPNGKFGLVAYPFQNFVQAYTTNSSTGIWTPGATTTLPAGQPWAVAYAPDSRFAAVTSYTNAANGVGVYSVDQTTGTLTNIATYPTGNETISVAYSPNGNFAATANNSSGTLSLFTVNSGTGLFTSVIQSYTAQVTAPASVAYSPNSNFAAVANNGGLLSVYGVNSFGFFLNTVPGSPYTTSGSPESVSFSPDGNLLAVANSNGLVDVYHINNTTGALTALSDSPFNDGGTGSFEGIQLEFSPTSSFIAVTNENSNNVSVIRLIQYPPTLTSAVCSAGNTVTVTGSNAGPGAIIRIIADGTTTIGVGTADSSGNFNFTSSSSLSVGTHSITVNQTLNSCTTGQSNSITVIVASPPVLTSAVANSSGIITVSGSGAVSGATITIFDMTTSTSLGTGTASGGGTFNFSATTPVSSGMHSIAVSQTLSDGCASSLSNAITVQVAIGTSHALVLTSAILNPSGFVVVVGYGAVPGTTVFIVLNCKTIIGSGIADAAGNFAFTSSSMLPFGINVIAVTQSATLANLSNEIVVAVGVPNPSLFITRLIEKYSCSGF